MKALRARLLGLGLLVCGPRDKLLWCGASLFAPILVVGQQLQEEFCMSVAWGRFGVPMGSSGARCGAEIGTRASIACGASEVSQLRSGVAVACAACGLLGHRSRLRYACGAFLGARWAGVACRGREGRAQLFGQVGHRAWTNNGGPHAFRNSGSHLFGITRTPRSQHLSWPHLPSAFPILGLTCRTAAACEAA